MEKITAFELQRALLREFYVTEEVTLDTGEFVPKEVNAKIHKDNLKIFQKTRRKLWRKHKKKSDFFSLADLEHSPSPPPEPTQQAVTAPSSPITIAADKISISPPLPKEALPAPSEIAGGENDG